MKECHVNHVGQIDLSQSFAYGQCCFQLAIRLYFNQVNSNVNNKFRSRKLINMCTEFTECLSSNDSFECEQRLTTDLTLIILFNCN